jgi:Protein of unknown function (DUF2838)
MEPPCPTSSSAIDDQIAAHSDGVTASNLSAAKITEKPLKRKVTEKVRHDENCFTVGVFNLMFCTFLIAASPWNYWIWHSIKMLTLLMYRRYKFAKVKYQYFLLDFCYTANYWSILYYALCALRSQIVTFSALNTFFNSWGGTIFRVLFTWCVGPLALSVAFFRNSLVFHSSDQIIILATHLSPNLAIYGMRWWAKELENQYPNTFHIECETSIGSIFSSFPSVRMFDAGENCEATFFSLFWVPLFAYVVLWTIPYALFFFLLGRKLIEEGGYHTMYSTMKDTPLMKRFLTLGGEPWRPVIYMLIHGVLCGASFLIAPFVWKSFLLHTSYLLILLFIAVRNAGTYYFEIFAERYYKTNRE